jgi:hypothetical protein
MTNDEPHRNSGDATLGSAPLASAHEAQNSAAFAPLEFDPKEFMEFVQDECLTETEAVELLKTIWDFVVAIVDLRFGLSPLQHVVDRSHGIFADDSSVVVESSVPSNRPKQQTVRRSFAKAAKEDS